MKQKISKVKAILLFIIALYGGYLAGGVIERGYGLDVLNDNIHYVIRHPFHNYINAYTVKAVLGAAFLYALAFLYYLSTRRNYMFGEEYGSAQWADIKELQKRLRDKKAGMNRILTERVWVSLDSNRTNLGNNNLLVIGGSGAGKSFRCVGTNLMQCTSTYIFTDPKGELLRTYGCYLEDHGYEIKVINLVNMDESDCYNPFHYIRSETDVVKLITNLIANTTPKGSKSSDPFWEKAESLYLQSLFYYVWMEEPPSRRNFNTLLELLGKAEVNEDGEESQLDKDMNELAEEKGENHPAVRQYRKCIRGAGDTVRSIIISANSRMAFFENPKLQRILASDDMDIPSLGVGKNLDKKTKTALFCVIPDTDKTYNFVVGMLYTQIFQELYYQADFNYGGRLPVPVAFWLDEFANVALPDDFCSLLSTMRSRGITASIIIQNMSQLKALFKDTWETITGNCSTLLYLGGDEQSTHKYISELLGKWTIDKRSSGESLGKNGSSSRNFDVIGRELLTCDEVRKMSRKKAICFISGENPVVDYKYQTQKSKNFKRAKKLGSYRHPVRIEKDSEGNIVTLSKPKNLELLSEESLRAYKELQNNGENVKVYEFDLEDFLYELEEETDEDINWDLVKEKISAQKEQDIEEENEEDPAKEKEEAPKPEESLIDLIKRVYLSPDQYEEVLSGLKDGLTEVQVKEYCNPELPAEKMAVIRELMASRKKEENKYDQ